MDDALTITTFGGLSIRRGDEPLTDLASRETKALLIHIAFDDHPQSREVLVEMLWKERKVGDIGRKTPRGRLSDLELR